MRSYASFHSSSCVTECGRQSGITQGDPVFSLKIPKLIFVSRNGTGDHITKILLHNMTQPDNGLTITNTF